jgi:hypothetical protein
MHVIENFVGKDYSSSLYKEMTSRFFPWFFFESMVRLTDEDERHKETFALHSPVFRHNFVTRTEVNSKIEVLSPLIQKIQSLFDREVMFYNIHANLLCTNSEMNGKYSLPHIDVSYDADTYNESECYTGIYYLNTCDSFTRVYNETATIGNSTLPDVFTKYSDVATEEDKFVYWDTNVFHSGPASTNKPRVLINVNFVVRK